MKHPRRAGFLFAGVILLLIAASAQSQSRPRNAPAEYRPILFVVEGGAAPLYLYGSLHVAPPDVLPPPAAAREAFTRSQRLITEVILDTETEREAAAAMMSRAFLQDGITLNELLTRQQYERLRLIVTQAGVPMEGIELMQPWAVELALTEFGTLPEGFAPNHGLDLYFTAKARAREIPIGGLESTEEQINAIAGGSLEEQVASLVATLSADRLPQILQLYHAWRAGDIQRLSRIVDESLMRGLGSYYERLLTRRNELWTERLQVMLAEPIPTFVVVGAAHLVGDDSVQRMLGDRGYTVRRVLEAREL